MKEESPKVEKTKDSKSSTPLGHFFSCQGDLRKFSCDAWLISSAGDYMPSPFWFDQELIEDDKMNFYKLMQSVLPKKIECKVPVVKLSSWPTPNKPIPFLGEINKHQSTKGDNNPWLKKKGVGEFQWLMEGLELFFKLAWEDIKNTTPKNFRQYHLIALPVIGCGGAGAYFQSGSAIKVILKVIKTFIKSHKCDVVLVANDDVMFNAIQKSRLELQGNFNVLPEFLKEKAEELASLVLKNQLSIFIGAGVSMGAGLPSWGSLLKDLMKEASLTEREIKQTSELDFLDQAKIIDIRLKKLGKSMTDIIVTKMKINVHSLNHALLANLKVNEIVTTNYDTLYEEACLSMGIKVRVLPYDPLFATESKQLPKEDYSDHSFNLNPYVQLIRQQDKKVYETGRWMLSMHGNILHPDDIVLSREHYLRYQSRRSALQGIVQNLLITKKMMFIGFSLTDTNFHKIVDDVRVATENKNFGYSLLLFQNEIMNELWENELEIIPFKDLKGEAPKGADFAEAARTQEIFMDYLLLKSTSTCSHLLEERFKDVLSEEEKKFKQFLLQTLAGVPESLVNTESFNRFMDGIRSNFSEVNINALKKKKK